MVSAGQLKSAIGNANDATDQAVRSIAVARDRAEEAMQALSAAADGSEHINLGEAQQLISRVVADLGDCQVQLQSAMQGAVQYAEAL